MASYGYRSAMHDKHNSLTIHKQNCLNVPPHLLTEVLDLMTVQFQDGCAKLQPN